MNLYVRFFIALVIGLSLIYALPGCAVKESPSFRGTPIDPLFDPRPATQFQTWEA